MRTESARFIAAAVAFACALSPHPASAEDFTAVDDAALAALRSAMKHTDCHEYAGAVIERDGSYFFTQPAASHSDTFELHIRLAQGEHLAAIYHTHPRCRVDEESTYFSPDDVATAKALRVPSYIGVLFDHSVRRFNCATDQTVNYTPPGQRQTFGRSAVGDVIATR
jgi:proteasome lid subunit RPN8/RPN11